VFTFLPDRIRPDEVNNAFAGAAIHLRKDELHLMIFMNGPESTAPVQRHSGCCYDARFLRLAQHGHHGSHVAAHTS